MCRAVVRTGIENHWHTWMCQEVAAENSSLHRVGLSNSWIAIYNYMLDKHMCTVHISSYTSYTVGFSFCRLILWWILWKNLQPKLNPTHWRLPSTTHLTHQLFSREQDLKCVCPIRESYKICSAGLKVQCRRGSKNLIMH